MNSIKLGEKLTQIKINNSQDVVAARFFSRQEIEKLGFSSRDGIRISTAVSELARNIIQHTNTGGVITLYRSSEGGQIGITIQAEDSGPGIADTTEVLRKSNTVMSGGLYGTMKFANDFKIESKLGLGTKVTYRKWNSN